MTNANQPPQPREAEPDESGEGMQPTPGEAGNNSANKEKQNESFTHQELKRIAETIGRTPDDEGTIRVNLALRYKQYKMLEKFYKQAKASGIVVQEGQLQDLATAKRELEEAMYLYEKRFGLLDEEQRRHEARAQFKRKQGLKSGDLKTGRPVEGQGYYEKAQKRREDYDRVREKITQELVEKLPNIIENISHEEAFQTYELNNDKSSESDIKDRRAGYDNVGKNGLFDKDKNVDFGLIPRAPQAPKKKPENEPGDSDPNGQGDGPEIGDINIKGIEQTFAEDKTERLKELEGSLEKLLPDLAEFYARNRRLIIGGRNRARYESLLADYRGMLDEYLRLKGGQEYEKGKHEIAGRLETRIEELKAEIEKKLTEFAKNEDGSFKTQEELDAEKARLIEEAEKTLNSEYGEMIKALGGKTKAQFIEDFVSEKIKLQKATTDALDGVDGERGRGSICRKFVRNVLNNKKLHAALAVAAAAGLAVTGIGLATGAVSLGLSYTLGGVTFGAARGATSAGLLSRQDSRQSAIQGFAGDRKTIEAQLSEIDFTKEENPGVAKAASWLMGQYDKARAQDLSSNRKRTAVAVGLGAVLGGVFSGIRLEQGTGIIGYQPSTYEAANLDQVNVSPNHGFFQIYNQLGGDPALKEKALQVASQFDSQFNVVSDRSLGVLAPAGNAVNIYPGKISAWPSVAQDYIKAVTSEWAKLGYVPANVTQGAPIIGPIQKAANSIIPAAFHHYIAQATAAIGAGLAGRVMSGAGEEPLPTVNIPPETPPETPPEEPNPTPETPPTETDGSTPENPPTDTDGSNPENPNPTPEVDFPGSESLTPEERAEVNYWGDIYMAERGGNASNDQVRLTIINALGGRLGYSGFENNEDTTQVQEALNNLPEEDRNRLLYLYQMIVRRSIVIDLRNRGYSEDEIRQSFPQS